MFVSFIFVFNFFSIKFLKFILYFFFFLNLKELHVSVDEEAEKELLLLFCRVNELETDKLSIQGDRMMDAYELHRSEQLLNRYQEQQKISDRIITKQRQLIEGV